MTGRSPRLVLWTIAGITAAGLLVRAPRLTESLWYDEIAAWTSHTAGGPIAIMGSFAEPSNHIAHTLLCWYTVSAFEQSLGFEIALRLPALLFSLAAIGAMYGLAREVTRTRPAAIAAGLMAVLPVAVLEAAEARGYSMMICFSALASWTLLANVRDERAWRWALYAALCAAGAWTLFVTAFVPIGHAVWLGWRAARHRETGRAVRGGVALALAAATTIAVYAPAFPDLLDARGMYVAGHGDEPSVFGPEGWHALLQLGGSWYAWTALPGLALLAIGGVATARSAGPPPSLRDAAAVTLLGLPVFLLVVLVSGSWMYARFTLFSLPGAVLLVAVGIDGLWTRRRAAGIAAAVLVAAASLSDLVVRPAKQPLRDAAELVRSRRGKGETILVIGIAHRVIDVYLADLSPQYSFMHGADLESKLTTVDPEWIVLYYPNNVSAANYTLLESRGYETVERFPGWVDWSNGNVVVYKRKSQ
jgi:4-amino-4-deoxy-L-arabinose transferase-like glycosyltransferase